MIRLARHVLTDLAFVYAWYFGTLIIRYAASKRAVSRALRFGPVDPSFVDRILASMFD